MKGLWQEKLKKEFSEPYYRELYLKVNEAYKSGTVYPPQDQVFNAFVFTPYEEMKVVILGQDPYHEPGQAHGMAFSVKPGVQLPPSLLNMYKEINSEFGYPIPKTGYLLKWAEQGVLLLNTVLTVRNGEANSHQNKGWENFTDEIIRQLNARRDGIVFLLWGNNAKKKKELITNPQHLILETVHPSPLSASKGFMGCGHFKKANEFLISNLKSPIDWQIED